MLLLCLSNFLFLPAIVLAFRRKFYSQCTLYTLTMVFSTVSTNPFRYLLHLNYCVTILDLTIDLQFYHACDQTSQFKFCLLPYSVLQFGDFYSSLTSVWLTALVVADPLLTESIRFFIGLTGTVIIAVCVHYDATSLATFLIPTVSGLLLISASWVNNSMI